MTTIETLTEDERTDLMGGGLELSAKALRIIDQQAARIAELEALLPEAAETGRAELESKPRVLLTPEEFRAFCDTHCPKCGSLVKPGQIE